jgi:bisphosphoglycerate-dependent phosphoglycerate mutase
MHLSEATERARGILTLKAFEKVVYLVRHGQSTANTVHWEDEERMDTKFRDAPLTDKGKEQAKYGVNTLFIKDHLAGFIGKQVDRLLVAVNSSVAFTSSLLRLLKLRGKRSPASGHSRLS